MTKNSHQKYLHHLQTSCPLVLCLTNTVTVTDCANALLAIGAAPVMSEDPSDAAALAGIASSLVVNIGTVNNISQAVMESAVSVAKAKGLPIVLDPVGAGASARRLEAAATFLKSATIVRGNASEIMALAGQAGVQRGVDSSVKGDEELVTTKAQQLAAETKTIVAVSGKTDLITDGTTTVKLEGGTPLLTRITGTGCMLSVIVGAYAGCWPEDQFRAAAAAHLHMARASENAQEGLKRPLALGSFKVNLFDELALLEGSDLDRPKGIGHWKMDA
ncbi:MAG: hydroxyethylthiazole kinase [Deltaproteobacteria bacterium]|jgi:hydroxyethylthiazole kinase|nr:hydroxyethylthiazole kinase [Deltaproteobacteria bacterium]